MTSISHTQNILIWVVLCVVNNHMFYTFVAWYPGYCEYLLGLILIQFMPFFCKNHGNFCELALPGVVGRPIISME